MLKTYYDSRYINIEKGVYMHYKKKLKFFTSHLILSGFVFSTSCLVLPVYGATISVPAIKQLISQDTVFENNTYQDISSSTNGSALYLYSKTGNPAVTIKNSTFINNSASSTDKANGAYGGAISLSGNISVSMDHVIMTGNSADTTAENLTTGKNQGGAYYQSGGSFTGNNLTITNNKTTGNSASQGAAMFLYGGINGSIENSVFSDNFSTASGSTYFANEAGALYIGAGDTGFKVSKSDFINNHITSTWAFGGALSIRKNVTLEETNFINNKAIGVNGVGYGGALLTSGANLTVKDSTFNGNNASDEGGAIYNYSGSTISFIGNNNFLNNTTGTQSYGFVKNDIYNDGTLNISDSLTLDGGISGSGNILFKENSSLTATLNNTFIQADTVEIENNSSLNLIIPGGTENQTYDFITASLLSGTFATASNPLYELDFLDNGQVSVTKKGIDEILTSTSLSSDTAEQIYHISGSNSSTASLLSQNIQQALLNSDLQSVEQELKKTNPDITPIHTTERVVYQITNAISHRLSSLSSNTVGRSGGDTISNKGMWVQGLYNKSKLDNAFKGYTQGFALGVDTHIKEDYILGLGYSYSNTRISSDRTTNAYGDTLFAYAQYMPSDWYVNTMLSYGHTNYKEKASSFGVSLSSQYDIDMYATQIATGKNYKNFTPEIALRYIYTQQDKYHNGLAWIKTKNNDLLTGIASLKYTHPFSYKKVTIVPEIKLGVTYDFVADGNVSIVSIQNAPAFLTKGQRLGRFGSELSLSSTITYKDFDFFMEYDLGIKKNYTSQTGKLKIRYNF